LVGIGVFKAMVHTLTVYLHLIAACSAIGVILISDLKLSTYFFNSSSEDKHPDIHLEIKIIIASLAVLWATGLLLVLQGIAVNPEYLHNQKLQAKIILVIILTINAFALHLVSLPRIFNFDQHDEFAKTVLPASISNSIWFYAAFLGVARHWNFSESLTFVLSVWVMIWMMAFAAMYILIRMAKNRRLKLEAASVVY
jgi:hypothetical protein